MSVRSKPNREGEAPAEPERDGSELPEGWTTATFRDLVDVLDSRRIPINSDERAKRLGDVPYFGATGQVGWIDDFLFDEEILLIGEDGAPFFDKSKPIAYIVRGKSWVNNHAHVLRANGDATSNLYLKYFLDWFDFNGFVNGTTRLKLTQAAMNSIPVRVAPLAEQRRIVGKLELLLGKVSSSQQRLSRVPGLLKRFRQSVLAGACSGKLTADWREENPDAEPAATTIPPGRSSQAARASDQCILGDCGLSVGDCGQESPARWTWTKLTDVARLESGHTPSRKHPEYWDGPIQWVGIKDARNHNGLVIQDTIQHITELGLANSAARLLPANTVCLTRTANSIGYSLILGREMATSQDLVGWVCTDAIEPKYLMTLFLAEHDALYRFARGSAHPTVYFPEILAFHACLPPLSEQQEIVRRVEKLFAFADQIEARLRQAQTHVDRLTQSLLAKAFRGELVPTEHTLATRDGRDYEPASVLLERLQQRSTIDGLTPRRKKGKT